MNRRPLMNRRPAMTRLVSLALGLLTVAWPLPWAPVWTYPLAALGALAALPLSRAPVLAVTAAIIASAFSDAPLPVLTAEGLFILAYLLIADAPPAMPDPVRWLRHHIPVGVSALTTTTASLAAFAVHPAVSPWVTVTGIVAAVAAYLVTVPKRLPAAGAIGEQTDPVPPAGTGSPQASMSSDASS